MTKRQKRKYIKRLVKEQARTEDKSKIAEINKLIEVSI